MPEPWRSGVRARHAWVMRRLTLDLTGLPPRADEVSEFASDPSDEAYEAQVDRLLDTQAFGEHRARYWLDVARTLEKGVRFAQIYHRGWDAHFNTPENHTTQCRDIDQACYGLITDLKQRGLLEDTLVIWGGEFGRTSYCQGDLTLDNYGRDHHPRCFSMWLAGGGVRPGIVYGETDDFSYNVVDREVPLRDFHATVLHLFGLDPDRLRFAHAGLAERLIGVGTPSRVVTDLLA